MNDAKGLGFGFDYASARVVAFTLQSERVKEDGHWIHVEEGDDEEETVGRVLVR